MLSRRGVVGWLAIALVVLVLAGGFLRFHQLGKKGFWPDELFTLAVAWYHPLLPAPGQPLYRPISVFTIADDDTFLSVKAGEQSPPLYDLVEKASVQAFGPSEWAARFPSALAACTLLVLVAWRAWRERDSWSRRVLAWSALLVAFHPALITYAKDGRAYSLGVSLIGMALLLWLPRWRHGWRHWTPPGWGETLLFLLACYTHYNAAAMVALLLLPDAVMATKTRSRVGWLRLGVLGVVFLAWVAVNVHTIVFTVKGGVAWGPRTSSEFAVSAIRDALHTLYVPWMGLALLLVVAVLLRRRLRGEALGWSPRATAGVLLLGLVVLDVALAGTIAAKAGMYHPRYYIFAVPLMVVVVALVLAELRGRWQAVAAMVLAGSALLSVPPGRPLGGGYEQFREMTAFGVRGASDDTLFLYPFVANRNYYRLYLDRFLGTDSRPRMVGVNYAEDAPKVCERLAAARHVVALGHEAGRARIADVYALCGARWPQREVQNFNQTFAEHWRSADR